jgi:hypothetical protein
LARAVSGAKVAKRFPAAGGARRVQHHEFGTSFLAFGRPIGSLAAMRRLHEPRGASEWRPPVVPPWLCRAGGSGPLCHRTAGRLADIA